MATAYINQERFGVEFEDRINKLLNIDPTETPFMSMVQKAEAHRNRVDWQIETLDTVDKDDAVIEGSTVTYAAGDYTAPTGLFNYTQIPRRPFAASFTMDAVNKPGMGSGDKSGFNHEKAKKTIVLKKNVEASLLSNNDRVQPLPESVQAGKLRGIQQWITTNVVSATDKTYGSNILSQQMFVDAAKKAVDQGGMPGDIFTNSTGKIKINEFVGRPTRDVDSTGRKIVDVVDQIMSIAGVQDIHFNRYLGQDILLMLDMRYWEMRWLRAPQSYIAGLLGSRTEGWVEAEVTLVSWAQKASSKITNLRVS